MIIVPLDDAFSHQNPTAKDATVREIQVRSLSAGLKGKVVPVWDSGGGRMAFIAPRQWHPFFQSIDLGFVWSNVNCELIW